MGDSDAAQAVALIRALRVLLNEMNRQLPSLEQRGCRPEAAALRRDIKEARAHIDKLQIRYLSDKKVPARVLARQAR
jgi:hypothetical protein